MELLDSTILVPFSHPFCSYIYQYLYTFTGLVCDATCNEFVTLYYIFFCAMPHILTKCNRISQILTCKMFNAFHMHLLEFAMKRWHKKKLDVRSNEPTSVWKKKQQRTNKILLWQINYRKIWSSKKVIRVCVYICLREMCQVKIHSVCVAHKQNYPLSIDATFNVTHTQHDPNLFSFFFISIVWNSVSENIRTKFMLNVVKWFADDHLIDLITE